MGEDTLADLKQFTAATVSQQLTSSSTDLKQEIHSLRDELKQDIKQLDKKIDDLSDSVAEAMKTGNDAVDTQLKDHEVRLTKPET